MVPEEQIEHLTRRAGFGASRQELEFYAALGLIRSEQQLLSYEAIPDDVDAVVVALKTRSIAAKDAVAQSLDALSALQAAGAGVWEGAWRAVLDELAAAGLLDTSKLYLDCTFAPAQKGGRRSARPAVARG